MNKSCLGSYKIRGLVELLQLCKSKTSNALANNNNNYNNNNNNNSNIVLASSRPPLKAAGSARSTVDDNDGAAVTSGGTMGGDGQPSKSRKPPTPTPRPPPASRFPWFKMLMGSVFSILLAFWTPKWTTILKIGGEAELVLKEVEQTAEVVEKVATVVEKVSEEMADKLPDDNKFKEAALVAEHISQEAIKDAHIAEDIIHKVEMVKQDLGDVGDQESSAH